MASGSYDLVIVGGGIQGVGVAQAAAARGHRVLLVEKERIAAATSSRSSKLIHGGLRYLESGQLSLVRESLRERATLLRIAPSLVRLLPFYVPVYRHSHRGPLKIRAGLTLYALLGGLAPDARFRKLAPIEWERLDGLETGGLRAVYRYHDAQTDDMALTHAVMRSAVALGAEIACPARFAGAEAGDGDLRIRYVAGGESLECRARALVNASGPWVNRVLSAINPAPPPVAIELLQGAHVLMPHTTVQGIYYIESPRDGRPLFVMPWGEHTLVGTTETPFEGEPEEVRALPGEVEYLLEGYLRYFPERVGEPLSQFAGLRVLPRGSSRLNGRSREVIIEPHPHSRPWLVTIAGGKLTGYRVTAEKVMERLRSSLPPARAVADTRELLLGEGEGEVSQPARRGGKQGKD
ncbi:MAG: glycerol-3-phosphate dehydrogenase/oxidase [Planctomycetota bacterium]